MQNWWNQTKPRVAAALRADPKKTTLMSVLAVVLLVVVGRLVLGNAHPAGALAALVQTGHVAAPAPRPVVSGKNALALSRWLSQPQTNLSRNLFATRLDYFPTDNSAASANAGSGDFWSQLGKSIAQATDEETKRENLKESFRQQAGKLRLQSTMAGAQPRAILEGKLVAEGSVVEDFRVEKIEARRVILERQGFRFELGMK